MVAAKNKLEIATSCANKEDASSLHLLTVLPPGWLKVTSFVTITATKWRL
jgi:hypothetical protein